MESALFDMKISLYITLGACVAFGVFAIIMSWRLR